MNITKFSAAVALAATLSACTSASATDQAQEDLYLKMIEVKTQALTALKLGQKCQDEIFIKSDEREDACRLAAVQSAKFVNVFETAGAEYRQVADRIGGREKFGDLVKGQAAEMDRLFHDVTRQIDDISAGLAATLAEVEQ